MNDFLRRLRESFFVTSALVLATACGGAAKNEPARAPEQPAAESAAPATQGDLAPSPSPAAGYGQQAAPSGPPRASAPSSTSPAESKEAEEPDDFDVLGRQLEGALTLSAPDCTTAWALRDRICDLSQRICNLSDRSAETDVAERCRDGRSRCDRATARVRASCAQ